MTDNNFINFVYTVNKTQAKVASVLAQLASVFVQFEYIYLRDR